MAEAGNNISFHLIFFPCKLFEGLFGYEIGIKKYNTIIDDHWWIKMNLFFLTSYL